MRSVQDLFIAQGGIILGAFILVGLIGMVFVWFSNDDRKSRMFWMTIPLLWTIIFVAIFDSALKDTKVDSSRIYTMKVIVYYTSEHVVEKTFVSPQQKLWQHYGNGYLHIYNNDHSVSFRTKAPVEIVSYTYRTIDNGNR